MSTLRSDIRIYSDINEIVKSYGDAKIQRSLRYLRDMGVKSGITVPLSEFGLHSGLLFINSSEVGAFDNLSPEDYATLCLMKIIASNILYRKVHSVASMDQYLTHIMKDMEDSNFFDVNTFSQSLREILDKRFDNYFEVNVDSEGDIPQILFNDLPLCYLIARTFEVGLLKAQKKINVRVSYLEKSQTKCLRIECEGISLDIKDLAFLETLSFLPGQNIKLENDKLVFLNSIDLVVDGLDYSV